jgi:hypothetical protein
VHAGRSDPVALGRAGGRASARSRNGIGSNNLRGLAKRQLEGLLRSDDERIRIQAAKALYSFGSQAAPIADVDEPAAPPPTLRDGSRVTSLGDVLALADQLGVVVEPMRELRAEVERLRLENEQLRAG